MKKKSATRNFIADLLDAEGDKALKKKFKPVPSPHEKFLENLFEKQNEYYATPKKARVYDPDLE